MEKKEIVECPYCGVKGLPCTEMVHHIERCSSGKPLNPGKRIEREEVRT